MFWGGSGCGRPFSIMPPGTVFHGCCSSVEEFCFCLVFFSSAVFFFIGMKSVTISSPCFGEKRKSPINTIHPADKGKKPTLPEMLMSRNHSGILRDIRTSSFSIRSNILYKSSPEHPGCPSLSKQPSHHPPSCRDFPGCSV